MRTRNRSRLSRSQIDREYPHQVEIPIPEGGLGRRINKMHEWCMKHAPDYQLQSAGKYPNEAVRFCFARAEDAAAFRSANVSV